MSRGANLVRRFWERVQARDWDGAGACLADDVDLEWRHTGERFRGRDNVIAMNRAYPEGWRIEIVRVVDLGSTVVSEVRVPHGDDVFFAASVFDLEDGLIRRGVEYWVEAGSEDPPAWRRPFSES